MAREPRMQHPGAIFPRASGRPVEAVCRPDFAYDGLLRRRTETNYTWAGSAWLETNEVHYVYDGNLVIQERNSNNVPCVIYTRGNDLSGTFQGAGGIGGLLARSTASGAAANTNVIYVTGAGSTDFNGTYTWAAGAYWKYDTMRIMTFYEGGVCMWGLYYYYATINNGTLEYYTPSLDISGTWYKAFGTNPAPTAGFGGNVTNSVFYHADGNGNVTCLIDTNNVVQGCYSYDPYGNLLAMSGPLAEANTYRFSSKEWNGKAALYYYGYRFYDPNLQRWLNRDPFGEYGGLNLYGYVYNDPLGMLDPYGLALFGLYDSYGDYFSDVWDTFKGEGKGAGAELSFGLYKPCYTSALQRQGGYVGTGLAMAGETLAGGAGGWKAAGKAAKGMEYSHWVPARALPGGRGGLLDDLTKAAKLNGNYVSKAEHALSDPSRYRFMPKTWKAANPLPDPLTQQLNRLPLFPTGLAAGAGVAAAGAAASSGSGGGCQ